MEALPLFGMDFFTVNFQLLAETVNVCFEEISSWKKEDKKVN